MYNEKLYKEKVSRTILSKNNKQAYLNFNNSNNKRQELLSAFYPIQMCEDDIDYKSDKVERLIKRPDIFDPSDYLPMRRTDTFYGLLETLIGRQGPHVIPFSIINLTIQELDVESLSSFKERILKPIDFEYIIKDELEVDEIRDYEPGWGNLKEIVEMYNNLYEEFDKRLTLVEESNGDINEKVIIDEEVFTVGEIVAEIKNLILSLINLNPYATYGWATEGGASKEDLEGKGERKVNLDEIRSLDDIVSKKCIDFNVLKSRTFRNIESFKKYLQRMFVNVPSADINSLIVLMLENEEDLDYKIKIYAEINETNKLIEIANSLLHENLQIFHDYLNEGQFLMKMACVTILSQNIDGLNEILDEDEVVDIVTILCEYHCAISDEEKIHFLGAIIDIFSENEIFSDVIEILEETEYIKYFPKLYGYED